MYINFVIIIIFHNQTLILAFQ